MSRRLGCTAALVTLAAAALAGCGGGGRAATPATPFDYPASAPLGYRDAGARGGSGAAAFHDVSFTVPGAGRVQAFLVLPAGKGRVPGVVYLPGAGADRTELLEQAAALANRGAVALTLTPPSSAAAQPPPTLTVKQALDRERRLAVADVVAARRAVDVLLSMPRVDPHRIGLVGISYGARTGAVLVGVEPRIDAFVLDSGGADPVSSYVAGAPPQYRAQVRQIVTELDPLRWIRQGRPGTVLLQDGRRDAVVPREALLRLARAAPKGTTLRWYPAGHLLDSAAVHDQIAWLVRKLRIGRAGRGSP